MGQKVHPLGFRLGVYKDWNARWFARGNSYGDFVLEDIKLRKYVESLLNAGEISRIEIEKAGDNVRIVIHTSRPGLIIGKKGQEIDSLRKKIGNQFGKNIDISVQEIKTPELDAMLIAKNIALQLQRRVSFKQAMKRAALSAMRSGAKGIKICCSGRLGGAEIARSEWVRIGSIPLHTLRADVDYGFAEAKTTYGIIGVKVWLGKGEFQNIK